MGMRNTLLDLNDYLFEQIERLNDDELTGDALKEQLNKSKAIKSVGDAIIRNATLVLNAEKLRSTRDCDPGRILIGDKKMQAEKKEGDKN